MGKLFLTAKELATRWNVTTATLRQWRWHNKGPKYFKMSGRAAYRLEDIEAFEASREFKKLCETQS